MKHELWIIDNDKPRLKQLREVLKEEGLKDQIKIKQFDYLAKAYDVVGSPTFILIDTTSIMGGITLYGCFDTAISVCRGFAEKHVSSFICIQSAVYSWAEDIVEEIKDLFEAIPIEAIEADSFKIVNWLKKYLIAMEK